MKVKIVSKYVFNDTMISKSIDDSNVENIKDMIFISIVGSDDEPHFNENHTNVLNLIFDDISDIEMEDILASNPDSKNILFNREHAQKIIDFVSNRENVGMCYIHCHAGISRSGAVGTFVNDIAGEQKYFDFMRDNSGIIPNSYILRELRRQLNNI